MFTLSRKRIRWSILPALVTVVVALIGTEVPAGASVPDLYAASNGEAHSCKVIGSAEGYEAVICADILTGKVDPIDYYAKGQIEIICQTTSGTVVRCANVYAEGVFADLEGNRYDSGSYACGHSYGLCPAGRVIISEGEETYPSDAQCGDPTYFPQTQVWTVVYGGNTQIELPVSGKTIELDASNGNDGINYSTGHYGVCW
jgi:hypothetical protein